MIGLISLGRLMSIVTVPVLLALLLAYLFEPVVVRISRPPWMTRRRAALAIIVATGAVVVIPGVAALTYGAIQATALVGTVVEDVGQLAVALDEDPADTTTADPDRSAATPADPASDPAPANPRARPPPGVWTWVYDTVTEARERRRDGLARDPVQQSVLFLYEQFERRRAGDVVSDAEARLLAERAGDLVERALGFALGAFNLGFMAFLTGFFFYFISSGWRTVIEFARGLIPRRHAPQVLHLARSFDAVVSGFVRGRFTISFVQAGIVSVLYFAIGTPAAFILGPIVGILSLFPYASVIGVPAAMLLMLLDPADGLRGSIVWILLAPTIVYAILQVVDDYILTPTIMGRETNLNTPTILFAALAGGAVLGFYGLLLAIPIAACIKIVVRDVLWPRFLEWRDGRRPDFLPFGRD